MLTFLSAFLGLAIGVQPVELTVSGDIAAVELRLDGRTVGRLDGEPWKLLCDFGSELAPHELTAIGFDSEEREIARATRLLNLPQPRSRAEIVLLDDAQDSPRAGPQRARIVAHSADGVRPDAWRIRFDGEVLDVEDPDLFELPSYDASEMHLLQAELLFGRSMAHVEQILGGRSGGMVDTELTAYVVDLEKGKTPSPEEMQGWFLKDGESLDVVSVEQGGADIVLVQDATPRLWGRLNRIRNASLETRNRNFAKIRLMSGLKDEDRLRVILPVGEFVDGAALEQFHISMDFAAIEQGATSTGATERVVAAPSAQGLTAALPYPPEGPLREDAPRRIADAVAVAAQAASAPRRARVVVLVRDFKAEDRSVHSPQVVRRYLDRLRVPLVVWSPESRRRFDPEWGEVQDIATLQKLQRAVIHLRRVVDRQVVVWIRGRHLPQDIELSETAAQRLSPIRSDVAPPDVETTVAEAPNAETPNVEAPNVETSRRAEGTEVLVAQTPAAQTPAAQTPAVMESTTADVVDVRLVELQVAVSDQKGNPIRDLDLEDFTVYENGEPVEIRHFAAPKASRTETSPGDDLMSPQSATEAVPNLMIFFDASRLDLRGRRELASAMDEILGRSVGLRTMVAGYDRSLKVLLPFTTDHERLTEILEQLERGELLRPFKNPERDEIAREIAEIEAALTEAQEPLEIRMAESRRSALLAQLRTTAATVSDETQAVFRALRDVTTGFGGIEGRKALLYVGAGLEAIPVAELYDEAAETLSLTPREITSLRFEQTSLENRGRLEALLKDAQSAEVAFYGLTPKSHAGSNLVRRARASAVRPGVDLRMQSARDEQIRETTCLLSDESGGLCQTGGTRIQSFLRRLTKDLSSQYTLAFTPSHPPDGAFHRLQVEVGHPNANVRHRLGYTDRPPSDQLHDRLASALFFGVEENALGMTIEVGETRRTTNQEPSRISLDVRIPVERLGLQPIDQGQNLKAKAMLLVTTNGAGGTTKIQEYPIVFQLAADRLKAEPPVIYSHQVDLVLQPGEHDVAIGVWDEISEIGAFLRRSVSAD